MTERPPSVAVIVGGIYPRVAAVLAQATATISGSVWLADTGYLSPRPVPVFSTMFLNVVTPFTDVDDAEPRRTLLAALLRVHKAKKPDAEVLRLPGHLGYKQTPGSEIMINRAVRQCAIEGIWVVTIHDCPFTYPEHAERVRQIMVEAFESVGVSLTIKVTAFD